MGNMEIKFYSIIYVDKYSLQRLYFYFYSFVYFLFGVK